MNTKLYVFSGTGNSLKVAEKIKSRLENAELISIPQVEADVEIRADRIGIISPIYMHNMPHIVASLIKKIKEAKYIFFVYTGAGDLGKGIGRTKKLFKGQGLKLSSLFNVPMPGNFIPKGCPSKDQQKAILEKADGQINEIVRIVQEQREYMDGNNSSFMATNIHPGLIYKVGYPMINTMDRSFSANENCNGCGICQQVCPVNNISITNGKPEWHNNCEQCFACLHWCPREAIQYRDMTSGMDRYRHPEVKLHDIIAMAKK